MKKLILLLSIFSATTVIADDLTAVVKGTQPGLATGSVDLTVSGGTAPYTYSWSDAKGVISSSEDIDKLGIGTYTVTVTDKYCGTATLVVKVTTTTGISDTDTFASISISPNPAQDFFSIHTFHQFEKALVKITNINGKTVQQLDNLNGNEFRINVAELSAGIYFIEVIQDKAVSRTKLIKN